MKTLISLNIFLFVLSFFLVEKDAREKIVKNRKNGYIFSSEFISELDKIKLNSGTLIKDNRRWRFSAASGIQIDQKKIIETLNRVSKLKIKRKLTPDFKFKKECQFELNDVIFQLGRKQNFSEMYYVKIDQNINLGPSIFLVHDTSPQTKPLAKDVFRLNPFKHKSLLDFCASSKMKLFEKKIFHSLSIDTMSFRFARFRPFDIDFSTKTTTPGILRGLEYDKYKFKSFSEYISSFSIEKFLTFKPKNLIFFGDFKINQNLSFSIYRSIEEGFFFYRKDLDQWMKIGKEKILFISFQDFWNKTVLTKKLEARVSFTKGKRSFSFLWKKNKILNPSKISIDYQRVYRVMSLLEKDALFVKRINQIYLRDFEYDLTVTFNNNDYLIKDYGRVLSVVDKTSFIQFEIRKENSYDKLAFNQIF